jgi:predicted DNA-binding transcriptional regulator AlpA
MQTPSNLDGQVILTLKDLRRLGITVSRSSLYRWEYEQRFPRRIRLAGTRVGWIADEIRQWLAELAEKRSHTHYADPF